MKRLAASMFALLMLAPGWAWATEYWSGYDDETGDKVEVIVRFNERMHEGADIFVRGGAAGSQTETRVDDAAFSDGRHVRIIVRIGTVERRYSLTRD